MYCITFKGEESARFSTFAKCSTHLFGAGAIKVHLIGRDALTSQYVDIKGTVNSALSSGYLRQVEIIETETGLKYIAKGNNTTSDVATSCLSFYVEEHQKNGLVEYGKTHCIFIPTLARELCMSEEWICIDESVSIIDEEHAKYLINLVLNSCDNHIIRESALALRSFESFFSHCFHLKRECEKTMCYVLSHLPDNCDLDDPRIAITELLGYSGSNKSIEVLKETITTTSNNHVKWAAIIALGRISSKDCIEFFYQQLKALEGSNESDSDFIWDKAALLLCISRRLYELDTKEASQKIEEIFSDFLCKENNILHRYICIGLSQLEFISEKTVKLLIRRLLSGRSIIDIGYYSLALQPLIKKTTMLQADDEIVNQLKSRLSEIANYTLNEFDPGFIWGMENLANFSLELEDNELASKFHYLLSNVFYDWRYYYFTALALHEKAELSVNTRPIEFSLIRFNDAINKLDQILYAENDEYVTNIVSFRKTIINARKLLLIAFNDWKYANDTTKINAVYKAISDSTKVFKQFVFYSNTQGASKSEVECIKNTVSILEVIIEIVDIHSKLLSKLSIDDEIRNQLINLKIRIETLDINILSLSHLRLTGRYYDSICLLIKETAHDSSSFENVIRLIKEIALYTKNTPWIFIAYMGYLTGLGSGSISVINGSLDGQGTLESPFTFRSDKVPRIELSITLESLASASIRTSVLCSALPDERRSLNITDGIATTSFDFSRAFFPISKILPLEFSLVFSNNEIEQVIKKTYYFKRCYTRKAKPRKIFKVFISYSWDDDAHKEWVKQLAKDLAAAGRIQILLDQNDLKLGDPLPQFMEQSIENSDYVLFICTPNYKTRANQRTGGVGYEDTIITGDIYLRSNHRKYIPVLARGSWGDSTPAWARGKLGVDMSTPEKYAQEINALVASLSS